MDNNIVQIGTALKWRSNFDSNKKYYQDNIVTAYSSVFRCKVAVTQGKSPVQTDENGYISYINTDVWEVVVDMAYYYNFVLSNVDTAQKAVELLSAVEPRIVSLESFAEKHEIGIKLNSTSGFVDDFGNEISNAQANEVYGTTDVKFKTTKIIPIIPGIYRFTVPSGIIVICKYYNGSFVSKTEYSGNEADIILSNTLFVGEEKWNQIRICQITEILDGIDSSIAMYSKADTIAEWLNNIKLEQTLSGKNIDDAVELAEHALNDAARALSILEVATQNISTLQDDVEILKDTVNADLSSINIATEDGFYDELGNKVESDENDSPTINVFQRTELLSLPLGIYHFNCPGDTIYLVKYNGDEFVSREAYNNGDEFEIKIGVGESAFNKVALCYAAQIIVINNATKLYSKTENLINYLDSKKAERANFNILKAEFDQLKNSVGQPNGIATLNANGIIDEQYLANAKEILRVTYWDKFNTLPNPTSEGLYLYNDNSKLLYTSINTSNGLEWKNIAKNEKTLYINMVKNMPYIYRNDKGMVPISPEDAPASIFNVTNQIPVQGYYVLFDDENPTLSAIHVVWNAGKAVSGLIISFEIGAGLWKTYQYIGKTVTEANWTNTDNWKDFGSLAAGSETYVIIDSLVGAPTVGEYYDLGTAVSALIKYQEDNNVAYAKQGLIISYISAENTMVTKQFQGNVNDFGNVELWKDFGGGGTDIVASDKPEMNGTDAFSTGGAYNLVPTTLAIDNETEGVVKIQMRNAEGEMIGDEVQFNVGTGSGGGTGTTIAVAFKENPMYNNVGGEFIVKAAIMSITKAGSQEVSNSITTVNFINRTTKKVVATFQPKKASSATLADFSFEFDLSSLCTSAGELPLQAQITDDGGYTATKNISLIAVDVTCESTQTLNYTKDTSLEVGGNTKNIPMYKFPNNASDKGILTTIEIYKNGEWQQLAQTTINDTYSHNVQINPTGLTHGAYPLRIQGQDVSSGVKGNVLHTSVMVIDQNESSENYNTPIVVARWSDDTLGKIKLFETLTMDVACFKRDNTNPTVALTIKNETTGAEKSLGDKSMSRGKTYTIEKRITEYSQGDTLILKATCGEISQPEEYKVMLSGSLLDINKTEGSYFSFDFASRSNTDTDKSIKAICSDNSEVAINVIGSNYSTNGFIKDSFGKPEYGTASDSGRMSLRIAEDVTATSTIKPYSNTAIETNGSALSFTIQVKNIADRNAVLMQCPGTQMGFSLTGEKLVVYTNGSLTDAGTTCTVPFSVNAIHRFDIVVEPNAIAPYGGIGCIKVFKDGDEAGAVRYTAGSFPTSDATIEWFGVHGDVYLYCIEMWNTYYNFKQAFDNYLIGLTDTEAMISEYKKNDVLTSQTAEGVTKDRPSMQKCLDAGICVLALVKNPDTNPDDIKSYPDYLEGLDGDKKTTILLDWYCYFPGRPYQNCIITADPTSNQGTTSSWRKIKNKKAKHKKSQGIKLMYTREQISEMYNGDTEILAKYDLCASMAKKNKLQVKEGGQFTNITTIKVDYSDSCGAHNGAMMELMNDTQRALGNKYMTPAQVYNEGQFDIQTSIDSIPCALFRTDHYMTAQEAIDPANAYFHAKANFNADKGDAVFFGFEGVTGYNAACLNYGDFTELVAARNQTLSAFKSEVLSNTSALIPGNIYVLSEWCGPNRIVLENDGTGSMQEIDAVDNPTVIDNTMAEVKAMAVSQLKWNVVYFTNDGHYLQYKGGVWKDTTGSMTFNSSTKKWSVTGRVVNPVESYELLKYDSFNWMQGVNSVDDLMVIDSTTNAPVWMNYYESRYPDDDDLNELYKSGKKVPYQLYKWLKFCQDCNHNLTESNGNILLDGLSVPGTSANRLKKWERELKDNANVYSVLNYTVASDYKATIDQRSKNMMITFYLDIDQIIRMYLNHWYDGDCLDGSDNDCGLTIPWDMDARSSHLYQGWDSVIFHQTYAASSFWLDSTGKTTITLQDVADAMRKVEYNNIKPFSPDGNYYYWITKRLDKWAKVISSYDGERKYIQNSTQSDNYFFALHGLRLDDLPDYQRKRFKYCDGQYQVGDLYVNPFKARMMGPISVTIKAAQEGFFGLGEDRADACADSCHLLAGESYTMRVGDAQEGGKMIYIFGADQISTLDISKCTPKLEAFSLEYCNLIEELIVGGEDYVPAYTTGLLSALDLGQKPFLKVIDIRNTAITTMDCTGCPRIEHIWGSGSELSTLSIAETSPINDIQLPPTMTEIKFIGLPRLTYTGADASDGLQIEGLTEVQRMRLENSPKLNAIKLLSDVLEQQGGSGTLSILRISGMTLKGDASELIQVKDLGVMGIDADGNRQTKPAVVGEYMLTTIREQWEVDEIIAAFDGLSIVTVVEAFIEVVDAVNAEYYGGTEEVETITLDNIGSHFVYYNGETKDEYMQRYEEANMSIHDYIKL